MFNGIPLQRQGVSLLIDCLLITPVTPRQVDCTSCLTLLSELVVLVMFDRQLHFASRDGFNTFNHHKSFN